MTSATSNNHTTPRPARLSRSARYQQVLAAAQHVFVARGYHATAMDDIAEYAGVSKPVLYRHFPSKLDLYLALLDTHCDLLVIKVQAALDPANAEQDRICSAIRAYFEFIDHEGEAFRLVFDSDLRNEPQVRRRVERMEHGCVQAIAGIISSETHESDEATTLLAVSLVGMATSAARFWVDRGRPVPRTDAEQLVTLLVSRGIGGFPPRST